MKWLVTLARTQACIVALSTSTELKERIHFWAKTSSSLIKFAGWTHGLELSKYLPVLRALTSMFTMLTAKISTCQSLTFKLCLLPKQRWALMKSGTRAFKLFKKLNGRWKTTKRCLETKWSSNLSQQSKSTGYCTEMFLFACMLSSNLMEDPGKRDGLLKPLQ